MDVVLGTDSLQAPLTGIGRYTLELARGLLRSPQIERVEGYDLGRLHSLEERLDSLSRGGAEASPAGFLRRQAARSSVATALYRHYVRLLSAGLLRRRAGAVFHSPNFHLPRHPGPSVVTVHDLSFRLMPESHPGARVGWMSKMVPEALASSTHIISVSESTRRDLVREYSVAPEKVSVIPLGVGAGYRPRGADEVQPLLSSHGLDYARYFFCVATLEPRKNIDVLLDAFLALPGSLRVEYPLVLVGAPGWGCAGLVDRLQSLGAADGVRWLGYVAEGDLELLYSGAHCFVYPSRYEGFGLPVIEAQASGLPVITSRVSSLPEVAGEHCLLLEPGDVQALGEALARSVEDVAWREAGRRAGPASAEMYTWERCVERTIEVYRSVLGE